MLTIDNFMNVIIFKLNELSYLKNIKMKLKHKKKLEDKGIWFALTLENCGLLFMEVYKVGKTGCAQ